MHENGGGIELEVVVAAHEHAFAACKRERAASELRRLHMDGDERERLGEDGVHVSLVASETTLDDAVKVVAIGHVHGIEAIRPICGRDLPDRGHRGRARPIYGSACTCGDACGGCRHLRDIPKLHRRPLPSHVPKATLREHLLDYRTKRHESEVLSLHDPVPRTCSFPYPEEPSLTRRLLLRPRHRLRCSTARRTPCASHAGARCRPSPRGAKHPPIGLG